MSPSEKPMATVEFDQRLENLRSRIDLLPREQQHHLLAWADAVERQRRQLQDANVSDSA